MQFGVEGKTFLLQKEIVKTFPFMTLHFSALRRNTLNSIDTLYVSKSWCPSSYGLI
jgi:hypothetical protein